jgi:RNA polymerase sigma-70 factor (ECF subfamily)
VFTTSTSLLERLRHPADTAAWDRLVNLYTPLLLHWARGLGLQDSDAADLVQDVLVVLVKKLPEVRYEPGQSFRSWMRTVMLNKWRDRPRPQATVPIDIAPPISAPVDDSFEEREYRAYVVAQALQVMKSDFEATTWQACWNTMMLGRPASEVAVELQISVNAVYLAKSRVLARLREHLAGLLD